MKKAGVVAILIVTVVGLFLLGDYWRLKRQKVRDEAEFARQFETLRIEIPLGTPLDVVLAKLSARGLPQASNGRTDETMVDLTTITSAEFYCSAWIGYASLRFSEFQPGHPLVSMTSSERGKDCL